MREMKQQMRIEWSKPAYLNIKWDNGPNHPASPLTEITRDEFLRAFFCYSWGLDGLNFGGSAPLPETPNDRQNWYRWQYFFFHRQALAIATKYGGEAVEGKCFLPPASKYDHGYDVRFYRLGCLHPNMQRGGDSARHESTETCPDCGFGATYDTSG